MSRKSIFGKKIEDTITSDDILGKEVIDAEGKTIGVVEKVLIDPVKLNFVGVEVDKGFLKRGVIIGKSYITKIAKHALFINIRVVYEIKGMDVLDKTGKKVGTVSGLDLWGNKNKIKVLHIKQSTFKKEFTIPEQLIDKIGKSVILNVEKNDLSKYQEKKVE